MFSEVIDIDKLNLTYAAGSIEHDINLTAASSYYKDDFVEFSWLKIEWE